MKMGINEFFRRKLGSTFRDPRKSWGAYDVESNRVFLRIGQWALEEYEDWAVVFHPDWQDKFGPRERQSHIQRMREGADGYAVLVEYNDENKIKSYDDQILIQLGEFEEEDGIIYAEIVNRISVNDITHSSGAAPDLVESIEKICSEDIPETTRQALIKARLGQGKFRTDVLEKWDNCCAVTGISVKEAIRASHIKPWGKSNHRERLSAHNGLPLVATLDALFDRGLISFDHNGQIKISPELKSKDIHSLGLKGLRLKKLPEKQTARFLTFHHNNEFRS